MMTPPVPKEVPTQAFVDLRLSAVGVSFGPLDENSQPKNLSVFSFTSKATISNKISLPQELGGKPGLLYCGLLIENDHNHHPPLFVSVEETVDWSIRKFISSKKNHKAIKFVVQTKKYGSDLAYIIQVKGHEQYKPIKAALRGLGFNFQGKFERNAACPMDISD